MPRRSTSKRWLKNHASDPFVKQREAAGYRSRAAFKLKEILARDRLVRRGDTVLELGSSPGGWSQVAAEIIGPSGTVVAVDVLSMDEIPGVSFIHGDCREPVVLAAIRREIGEQSVDLVMSDMAPNITGIRSMDVARSLELAEVATELAREFLRSGGSLILKLFQHAETDRYAASLRDSYSQVLRRRPRASRTRSTEFYVLARGFGI